jgi:cob(I)alamin adenosyltransferase
MILSFYGNGKGKTSVALGITLRASGYGKKILFAQFVKGEWKTGEQMYLEKMKNVTFKQFGLGFVGIKGDKHPLESHKKATQKGLEYLSKHILDYDLVVLDEVFVAVKSGLISQREVKGLYHLARDNDINLIATGRPKIDSLLKMSDLVSEIINVSHPFDRGEIATQAIDY